MRYRAWGKRPAHRARPLLREGRTSTLPAKLRRNVCADHSRRPEGAPRQLTLRYAHEIRSETEYFADIPSMNLPDEMLRIAEHILETKKDDFDPAFLEDRYRTVLVEKLRDKQAQMPARPVASIPSQENIINLWRH